MRTRRKGSVLLLTMFFLMLMAFLAVAFMRMLPGEFHGATRERLTVQGRYVTEAGVQSILYKMQTLGTTYVPAQGETGTVEGGWTWEITEPVVARTNHYWVTVEAKRGGESKRRARVVIDKGLANLPAWFFPGMGDPGNNDNAWDFSVNCIGDIWVEGVFRMKEFDTSYTGPAKIDGTVYFTGSNPDSPCGAEYVDAAGGVSGGKPYAAGPPPVADAALYSKIYASGQSAVRPNSSVPFSIDANNITQKLVDASFGSGFLGTDSSAVDSSGFAGRLYVNGTSNTTSGGVYIKGTGSNEATARITLGVAEPDGDFIAKPAYSSSNADWANTFNGGNSVMKINFTKKTGSTTGPENVKGPPMSGFNTTVESDEWYVTEVKKGFDYPATAVNINGVTTTAATDIPAPSGSPVPATDYKLVIYDKTKKNFFVFNTENDEPTNGAVFVDGAATVQGVQKGSRTIGAATDMTIDGELLKSCIAPGNNASIDDPDVLGVMKGLPDSPTSGSDRFNITIDSNPHASESSPHTNRCYIYAAIMGLAKSDLEAPPAGGSEIWSGGSLWINGSLLQDGEYSTSGHLKKMFDFFGSSGTKMILDPQAPDWWYGEPRPSLKAYVDIPVYKQ